MKTKQKNNSEANVLQNVLPLLCCLVIGVLLGIIVFSFGQQHQRDISDLRKEISALNSGQTELKTALNKDIGEIRDLLRRQPTAQAPAAPREIVLSVDASAPFKGNPNAAVTLVEFTDYQCGFCARYVKETFPQLERDYIATGKLKYVFRNFPLESIHQQAFKAHEASSCASDQGKFWEMHDRLFSNPNALAPPQLVSYAQGLGLDARKFEACFNAATHAAEIRRDIADGQKAGVTGTPTFFLGTTIPNSPTLKATTTLVGAKQYSAFKEAIDALLAAKPAS